MPRFIILISSFLFFIFGAFSLLVDGGYAVSPATFFLLAICLFWVKGDRKLDKDDGWFILALLSYFSAGVLDTVSHGQEISNLDNFSRYLVAAAVLAYLGRYKLNANSVWFGFALGGLLVGFWAIYQKFYLGMGRAETDDLNAIHFGNLSMLIAVFCMAGVFWANVQKNRKLCLMLMLSAAFMAVLASLFSGTRSGWVGFPFVLFALYKIFSDHFPKKKVRAAFIGLLLTLVTAVAVPQTGIQSRLYAIQSNIESYMIGHTRTSVGLRFEMWRSAWYAFTEKPVLGWGEEAFYELQPKIVEEYNLDKGILRFNHLHNQYVEELAKRGLVGLVAFLVFLAIPFLLFYSRIKSPHDEVRALAAAGVVGVICMIDFCMTQAMMRINSGVMFYTFSMVFLWVCLRSTEKRLLKNGG